MFREQTTFIRVDRRTMKNTPYRKLFTVPSGGWFALGAVLLLISTGPLISSSGVNVGDVSGFTTPERQEQVRETLAWKGPEFALAAAGELAGLVMLVIGAVGFIDSKPDRKPDSP